LGDAASISGGLCLKSIARSITGCFANSIPSLARIA
jgi:hypothetical protein